MPKIKWNGTEEPTIIYININNRQFCICSLKCGSTEANRSISYTIYSK